MLDVPSTDTELLLGESPRNERARFYRPELDCLRFFAFLAVFCFHTVYYPEKFFIDHGLPNWIANLERSIAGAGAYGVDLFFVLSSFLITELLLREKEERGSLHIRAFYMRRILRIWPLYFAFVALVALVPALNPGRAFGLRYVVPFLLLSGNWSIVAYDFPRNSIPGPLWSISVEEQFYLLWPPIVNRLNRGQLIWAALLMIASANLMRIVLLCLHAQHPQVWCNTLARLDPMAIGILLAALLRGTLPGLSAGVRFLFLGCGIAALVFVARFADLLAPGPVSWGTTLIGYPVVALGAGLIVLAVFGAGWPIFDSTALRYLGKISYGLYVFHELAIWISDKLSSVIHFPGSQFIFALGITILLAAISYAVLESPFLKLKERFTFVQSRST